jgi:hypothetical protein
VLGGDEDESAAVQDVESEVAPAVGPFVVLLGQDGADEPDDRAPVGEDPDDVGAPADLAVQPLVYPAFVGRSSMSAWSVTLVG